MIYTSICVLGGAVLSQGLSYVTRLVRENRRHSAQETEFHLDSLLTIPADYEKLQSVANQPVDDLQGLRLGPRLGSGSGGTVFQGIWQGARIAVKILLQEKHSLENKAIAREVAISSALSHPSIVHVFRVSTKQISRGQRTYLETAILMEYCDQGTLLERHKSIWSMMGEAPCAGLRWILQCMIEVAGGLQHMHLMGLVHGDLKCNNIVLQSTRSDPRGFHCKIADMGCSRLLPRAGEALCTGTYGAPTYAAPELLKDGLLTQASDVYSLSIVMWHLLSRGNAFFQEENPARLYIRVAEQDERPPFPDDCNRDLKLLIEACWAPSPGDRPSITAVLLNLVQIYRSCPKV